MSLFSYGCPPESIEKGAEAGTELVMLKLSVSPCLSVAVTLCTTAAAAGGVGVVSSGMLTVNGRPVSTGASSAFTTVTVVTYTSSSKPSENWISTVQDGIEAEFNV